MRVLLCHNYYQEPGGEDRVFADEGALLESRGHEVLHFTRDNEALATTTAAAAALHALWDRRVYRALESIIARARPDIAHFHNTWPLISPGAYYACRRGGTPVVQTLHNYRLACPNAVFFRDGRPCEDCLGKRLAWPGVVHRCYRGSAGASATVATVVGLHRALGTWSTQVDLYIAPTDFTRRKLIAGGLPADRLEVRPHGLAVDPGPGEGRGGYVLFVGRLSPEKGVRTLLAAWQGNSALPPLRIVGDGPLAQEVRGATAPSVEYLGPLPPSRVSEIMADALCLVVPSECYETFGRVVVEAFAAGTPVIVSDGGAATELVEPDVTGLHFRTGDSGHLAEQVRALAWARESTARMRAAARSSYLSRYSPSASYDSLVRLYEQARGGSTGLPVTQASVAGAAPGPA